MNTSTLVVVPYAPVKEIPDYRQQFYSFVADFKERIERIVEPNFYPNIRVVVIDALNGLIVDDSKPTEELLKEQKMPYGALLNTAYYIAKHSSVPYQRILFHEPFYMPNRNLIRLYFEYTGFSSGCTHYTSVYRDLFPRNHAHMGVFSIDTDLFGVSNGFPNHLTDVVQIFERFQRRVQRISPIQRVYTNDVDRTSLFYHLFYEDVLGYLRTMPKKDTRDAYIQWSDRIYSVLDDEFSGIHQMPFYETHNIARLDETQNELSDTIETYRYTVRPTPILSFYNDFPHHFEEDKMTEYYGFMTELMNYIVRRLKQTYVLPASIDSEIRQSSTKKDEIIRILLSDTDTDDEMSILYGFRIVAQVIEEAKKWIEEFYLSISLRGELNRFEFLSSIIENITYYMIPMVHPDYPNEVQISISSYNYLYDQSISREPKIKLRQEFYKKWIDSLQHADSTMRDIPTMNHMPLIYVPSIRLHTDEYIEQVLDEDLLEQDIHVITDQNVNVEAVESVREIQLGTEGEEESSPDSTTKTIHIPRGSLSHRAAPTDYDEVLDDVNEYDISI